MLASVIESVELCWHRQPFPLPDVLCLGQFPGGNVSTCHMCALLEGPVQWSPEEAPKTQRAEVFLVSTSSHSLNPLRKDSPFHYVFNI